MDQQPHKLNEEAINFYCRDNMLKELLASMLRAKVRCMTMNQLCDELESILECEFYEELLVGIRERELTNADAEQLAKVLDKLVAASETLPRRERDIVLRATKRVACLLPSQLALRIGAPFLNYKVKVGRDIAYATYRSVGVPAEHAQNLFDRFQSTGDQELLILLAYSSEAVLALDGLDLVSSIEDNYWRARVVGVYLEGDRARARTASSDFPTAFVLAVALSRDESWFSKLDGLLHKNLDNLEFLRLYAYALGRLGRGDALRELEVIADSLVSKHAAESEGREEE